MQRPQGMLLAIAALALCALGSGAPPALAAPPVVTVEPASEVGVTSARARGEVNPKGKEASYHFEYVSDADFQAHDTVQKLIIIAFSGTYTISFQGQTTNPIAFDASPATVESELNSLATIGGVGGSVSVSGGPGDETGSTPYLLTFGGSFAETNVEALGVDYGGLADNPQYGPYGVAETTVAGHPEGFSAAAQAGFGNTPVEPEATLEGLRPGTEYHLRLVAENEDSAGTPSLAVAPNFTTDPVTVPNLALDPPSDVKYTTATISGSIDPEGGNANPIEGVLPIGWELQVNREGNGWEGAAAGAIEAPAAEESDPVAVHADLTGLQNGGNYKFRLKAFYAGGAEAITSEGEFQTLTVVAPTVAIDPVTTFTGTTAHITGHVNPNAPGAAPQDPAFDTTWHFECNPTCPGISGATIPADDVNHEVSVDATKLNPGVNYEVTLFAENLSAGGPLTAGPVSFDTPVIEPAVTTGSANVTSSSAAVFGSIDPAGGETSYRFDYGTSSLDQSTTEQSLPAGNEVKGVSANLTGLAPDTTYHYQLVASNSAGEVKGVERSFTTAAAPSGEGCPNAAVRAQQGSQFLPECRAFEIVNNPGLDLGDVNRVSRISDDGEHAATLSVVPGDEAMGAGVISISAAHRTPTGWLRRGADPISSGAIQATAETTALTFSSDFSKELLTTNLPADPAVPVGLKNLYRVDVGSGTSTVMSPGIDSAVNPAIGATPALDRVVFRLASGSSPGPGIYLSEGSGLELISRLPNGDPVEFGFALGAGGAYKRGFGVGDGRDTSAWVERGGDHTVSDDARRIYFYDVQNLYLRDLTGSNPETFRVSASERTGEPTGNIHPASFISATHDGSSAYFVSADQLTEDAAPGGGIYRFEVANKDLRLLTPAPGNTSGLELAGAIASDDQSHLYFTSRSALAPSAVAGEENAYVWSEVDGLRFIGAVGQGDKFERVSQDGRFALLPSSASIDGAPTNGHKALYEYDYAVDQVSCVSCRPDGSPSQGDAAVDNQSAGFPGQPVTHTRALTDDGRVFFDSSDRLVSRDQTAAQDVYVYERGQVSLLTTGQGDTNSYLAENSDDGDHAFVITRSALVGADRDSAEFDVYDIHVGGGFLEPPPPAAGCEGEACRASSSTPPNGANHATSGVVGRGNPKPCPRGKVRRNARCVKPAGHKHRGHKPKKRGAKPKGRTGR